MGQTLRLFALWLALVAGIGAAAATPKDPSPPDNQTPVQSINDKADAKIIDASRAIIVTSRQHSADGVLHRGCDFPTLVCHGGRPEICLQEISEQCSIESCIVKHEAKHLEDIAGERIEVCEGRENGQLALTPLGQKVLLERAAIKVEQSCLQGLLRISEGDCRRRISERLKRIAKFDSACVQGAENCKSPFVPVDPKELVTFCSL
jgi:hypothetical protein